MVILKTTFKIFLKTLHTLDHFISQREQMFPPTALNINTALDQYTALLQFFLDIVKNNEIFRK